MLLRVWTSIQSRLLTDRGASLVEYALLVALIAAVALIAVQTLGNEVNEELTDVANSIGGATTVP